LKLFLDKRGDLPGEDVGQLDARPAREENLMARYGVKIRNGKPPLIWSAGAWSADTETDIGIIPKNDKGILAALLNWREQGFTIFVSYNPEQDLRSNNLSEWDGKTAVRTFVLSK
jgi:hypothetical protein